MCFSDATKAINVGLPVIQRVVVALLFLFTKRTKDKVSTVNSSDLYCTVLPGIQISRYNRDLR